MQPLLEYCSKLSPVDECSVVLQRIANSPLWFKHFTDRQASHPALGKVLSPIQKLVLESDDSVKGTDGEVIPYALLYNI